ncbi:Glycosyltransferase family 1 protein [Pyrococcus sp. ST04]|nr:Glycosyltransferase family 1 protein [Pyrococcus sp. ST04]
MVGHYPPLRGGVARHVKELVDCLRARHEVHVLTYKLRGEESREENVYYVRVPNLFGLRGLSFSLLASKKIVDLDKKNDYDIIHAHYVGTTSYSAILAKKRIGKPVIVTAHGSDLEFMSKLPLGEYLVKMSLKNADAVITVSHYLARKAIALGANSVKVIPNWTNLSGDATGRAVIFMGRLTKYKGLDDFLKLAEMFPNVDFLVAGDGPLFSLSKDAPKNVKFLGYVKAENVLKEAKVLVLPSKREGFGLVLVEANSFGVPVLGRSVGGIGEIIRDGKNGYLFRDIDEAARFLEVLISNGKIHKKMGLIGRKVSKIYTLERACREVERIYEEFASSP